MAGGYHGRMWVHCFREVTAGPPLRPCRPQRFLHARAGLKHHTCIRKLNAGSMSSGGHRKSGGRHRTGHTEVVHHSGGLLHFRIWDINQKTFYLRNNQLVAGYLQGSNTKLEGEWLPGEWSCVGPGSHWPGVCGLLPKTFGSKS